ncbi:MAG TPA: Gfo/Idh/MocA family oxidoreductase [Terracidiphilus sp.]|jgi:predicted dehydrogenase|nr:Gfo/Idh/MocA family oxidoreductase [Terracidiphilus sp.]
MNEFETELWSRRRFMQVSAGAAVVATSMAHAEEQSKEPHRSMMEVAFEKREPRIAIIGTGGRGTSLLGEVLAADGQVVALCDIVRSKAEAAGAMVVKKGQKQPDLFTEGDHAYEKMLESNDIDLVIVATPWSWHAPMALDAMQHGKDVAIEVPGVTTIDDCWNIVKTSEQTGKHCMMLENCCYGYNETLLLRMTHAGVLGDLLYGEGAYLHDLREELFSNKGEGLWRRTVHTLHTGNLYPSHGLGPVANYMGIQRGDRFGYIVSMSTKERGLDVYRSTHLDPSDPRMRERYVTGDMNTSLIRTANGLTITVKHTVSTPHPYDRINQIAGTKGIFQDYPPRIYIDGQNADESWEPVEEGESKWKQYEYPLWTREGEAAKKNGGHGGMDYIMIYRLLQCVREGLAPDMDVYDAAAWSSVGPLSEQSVKSGSAPIEFPDFTRGDWNKRTASAIATIS